jgi:hypothetical protein
VCVCVCVCMLCVLCVLFCFSLHVLTMHLSRVLSLVLFGVAVVGLQWGGAWEPE